MKYFYFYFLKINRYANFLNSNPIILKMNKRSPTPKSLKAHSKINSPDHDYNAQYYRITFDANFKA